MEARHQMYYQFKPQLRQSSKEEDAAFQVSTKVNSIATYYDLQGS